MVLAFTNYRAVWLFQTALLLLFIQIQSSLDDSASRTNWNLAWETFPATIVQAQTIGDVTACVMDENECPTPVLAVGGMRSVTSCIVNDNGTLVDMSLMNRILSYDQNTGTVTCQAGVTLKSLHTWLLEEHNREISFSPEIGDASVGSLAVTTSKDSSVNGPGTFRSLITSLRYVSHNGTIVSLDRELDDEAFQVFLCSFGMLGIVVEVQIETREARQILTRVYARRGLSGADEAYEIMKIAREKADNVFVTVAPHEGVLVAEERYQDLSQRRFRSHILGFFKPLFISLIQRAKFYTIQHGHPFSDKSLDLRLHDLGILDTIGKQFMYFLEVDIVHYRSVFTNLYEPLTLQQERLDFTMYVYDIAENDETSQIEFIFKDTYNFAKEWHRKTGYAPKGFNIYFVNRSGNKPYGEFSGPPGVTFLMDPYENDPESIEWRTFVEALNVRQRNHRAKMSPTQSRFLTSADFQMPKELVHERFLTPHYAKFVVDS